MKISRLVGSGIGPEICEPEERAISIICRDVSSIVLCSYPQITISILAIFCSKTYEILLFHLVVYHTIDKEKN